QQPCIYFSLCWELFQPQADFNVQAVEQMMAGKWYLIGIATDAQWFVSHRASMKMGTAMITPTADGDLEMSIFHPNGSCWRMNNLAKKTEIPGKFIHKSADLRMVDVKYDEYALIHSIKTKGKESYVVNKLYGNMAFISDSTLCSIHFNLFCWSVKLYLLQQIYIICFHRACFI
uniref:Lipocalin/cytosolic fatty-acid binding domain-containing protein n=1 Tax=Maylandia zebra TaxID=106582 RepID=A0A3P9DTB4_9CICH